jgi:hypothetical protein
MVAIRAQIEWDGFESIFAAGMREVLEALRKGEPITVEDE